MATFEKFIMKGASEFTMKDYQDLIGKIIIALAIVLGAVIIAGAIESASLNIRQGLSYLGELLR